MLTPPYNVLMHLPISQSVHPFITYVYRRADHVLYCGAIFYFIKWLSGSARFQIAFSLREENEAGG